MHFELANQGTTTSFQLSEGLHRLGGGREDTFKLEGLPEGLLELQVEGSRLLVEGRRAFTVGGREVAAGTRRLLLPGEVVELGEGLSLKLLASEAEPERGLGTVAVLRQLFTDAEVPAPSRAAALVCVAGPDVGRTFPLAEESMDLGRGPEAALRLRDLAVSRRHARLVPQENAFVLEDLGSPNGVWVNGRRLEAPALLAEGDILELGRTQLRFQAPLEAPLDDAPPLPSSEGQESAPEAVVQQPPAGVEALAPAAAQAGPSPAAPEAAGEQAVHAEPDATSEKRGAAEPEPPSPLPSRPRWEGWFIGLGMATALVGVAALYMLSR